MILTCSVLSACFPLLPPYLWLHLGFSALKWPPQWSPPHCQGWSPCMMGLRESSTACPLWCCRGAARAGVSFYPELCDPPLLAKSIQDLERSAPNVRHAYVGVMCCFLNVCVLVCSAGDVSFLKHQEGRLSSLRLTSGRWEVRCAACALGRAGFGLYLLACPPAGFILCSTPASPSGSEALSSPSP